MIATAIDLSQLIWYNQRRAISHAMPPIMPATGLLPKMAYTIVNTMVPIIAAKNAVFIPSLSPNSLVTR